MFAAEVSKVVLVELPAEAAEEGMCAKPVIAMYGTRHVAQSWEGTYRQAHEDRGVVLGTCPSY